MGTVVFVLALVSTGTALFSILFAAAGRMREAAALIAVSLTLLVVSLASAYVLGLGVVDVR